MNSIFDYQVLNYYNSDNKIQNITFLVDFIYQRNIVELPDDIYNNQTKKVIICFKMMTNFKLEDRFYDEIFVSCDEQYQSLD